MTLHGTQCRRNLKMKSNKDIESKYQSLRKLPKNTSAQEKLLSLRSSTLAPIEVIRGCILIIKKMLDTESYEEEVHPNNLNWKEELLEALEKIETSIEEIALVIDILTKRSN